MSSIKGTIFKAMIGKNIRVLIFESWASTAKSRVCSTSVGTLLQQPRVSKYVKIPSNHLRIQYIFG